MSVNSSFVHAHLKYSKIVGLSIIVMALLAVVAMLSFFEAALSLDAQELNSYFVTHRSEYLLALSAWVGILICDVLASWGFLKIYRALNSSLGLITARLRFIYSAILLFAIIPLFGALSLDAQEIESGFIYQFIHQFERLWSLGLIVFGLHLGGLAWLSPHSSKFYSFLKIMLFLGAIGYLLIHGLSHNFSYFGTWEPHLTNLFMAPMILGEVGLALVLWLKPNAYLTSLERINSIG